MDTVAYINKIHWDGPLRGRLAVIALRSGDDVEVIVKLDRRKATLVFEWMASVTAEHGALLYRRVANTAAALVHDEAHALMRQGPSAIARSRLGSAPLDLRVSTYSDVCDALAEALGVDEVEDPAIAVHVLADAAKASRKALEDLRHNPPPSVMKLHTYYAKRLSMEIHAATGINPIADKRSSSKVVAARRALIWLLSEMTGAHPTHVAGLLGLSPQTVALNLKKFTRKPRAIASDVAASSWTTLSELLELGAEDEEDLACAS